MKKNWQNKTGASGRQWRNDRHSRKSGNPGRQPSVERSGFPIEAFGNDDFRDNLSGRLMRAVQKRFSTAAGTRPIPVLFFLTFFLAGSGLPAIAHTPTLFGIDVLKNENFASLKGARVSLITNHTGLDRNGTSTVELFRNAPDIQLVNILTPEHGYEGRIEHGVKIENSTAGVLGIPVFSLYGTTTRPTDEMLRGVDTIVFDIQDIGARFYTYMATMGQALEEASKRNIKFIVLDRPNPIRGDIIEGDILDSDIKRLTGYFPIPVRYGLTVGELAFWFNIKKNINAPLRVVKMENWRRILWFDETGNTFKPTSPNIPTLSAALLYSGIGCFEATNISVGRGTGKPFQLFGAPWLKGKVLAKHLKRKRLPGAAFKAVTFTPQKDIYSGEKCGGVAITITDRNQIRPLRIFLESFIFLFKEYPEQFSPDWEEIRIMTGSNKLKETSEGKMTLEELLAQYDKVDKTFHDEVAPYYLY